MLSGPSGVGKSTVVAHMRKEHPEVWLSVSATTRKPRPGEQHGVHYFFVTDEEMDKLIANGELLEWAEFAGNRYGTPRKAVLEHLEAGVPVLLEIDLQGARQVRESMPDALLVFLAPPPGRNWSAGSRAGAPSRPRSSSAGWRPPGPSSRPNRSSTRRWSTPPSRR